MSIRFDVIEQFNPRPTLRRVAYDLLITTLEEDFPALTLDPDLAAIGQKTDVSLVAYKTLIDETLHAFSHQVTPTFSAADSTLIADIRQPQAAPLEIDMNALNLALDTVSQGLLDGYCQALTDYWTAEGPGGRRLLWLSNSLRQQLSDALACGDYAALSDPQREALNTTSVFSEKSARDLMLGINPQVPSDGFKVSMAQAAGTVQAPVVALLLTGQLSGEALNMLYRPNGQVLTYTNQAQLLAALPQNDNGAVQWRLFEPENDCFEWLAQIMLEHQLVEVRAITDAQTFPLADIEQYLASVTDLGALLAPDAATSDLTFAQLPDWLRDATAIDRLAYSDGMATLAWVQQRESGQAFNDGLPGVLTFASEVLTNKMLEDHPDAIGLTADDIELEVGKVTAEALPSAGQIVTLGVLEKQRISLSAYALENLAGKPGIPLAIFRKSELAVPEWLTADYLIHATEQVDVGSRYPALLQSKLIDDKAEAARREKLFSEQLAVQLPLKALEQKIRGEGAVTQQGVDCVAALMSADASQRRDQVLRPLAFIAQAGARADVVSNMFVIGARDTTKGPFLLYRPFNPLPLSQFQSWSMLLAAISAEGKLQADVLDWLSDHARIRYGNGGFIEPHIVRVGLGSEFAPISTPAPAILGDDVAIGEPLAALFVANARALVGMADRNTVSNAESRWANLKQGGWLLLNAVLPFAGGSVGKAAWMTQLLMSTEQLLSASVNEPGDSKPFADLLLNISLVLLHQGLSDAFLGIYRPASRFSEESVASVSLPIVLDSLVPDTSRLPDATRAVLDFSWSSPSSELTPGQQAAMIRLRVTPEPDLDEPLQTGVHQGLYQNGALWFARIDGHIYRVSLENERVRIISSIPGQETGPYLKHDQAGWRPDLALKLRGGSPRKNARKLAVENAELIIRVVEERAHLRMRQNELLQRIKGYNAHLTTATGEVRQRFLERFEVELKELLDIVHRRIKLSNELREQDRQPEKTNAVELKSAARRVCYFEALLLGDMLKMTQQELGEITGIAEHRVTPENVEIYQALFGKLLLIQVRGRHWAGIRNGLWKTLRELPKIGEEYWRVEVMENQKLQVFTELEWHVSQLWSLLELSFSRDEMLVGVDSNPLKALRNQEDLHQAFISHAELDKPNDYSLAEQMSVLESSLREYERAIDVTVSVSQMQLPGIDNRFLNDFLTELGAIGDEAEARLSALIRESAEPPQVPSEWMPKVAQPLARVIRTRNQRTLVGRVREGETDLHGEVVDVTDALGARVIGTYHKHGEDWVAVVDATPVSPVVKPKLVPLTELKSAARKLLDEVEPAINNARRQSTKANEPEDMEDILVQRADRLNALRDKLKTFSADASLGEGVAAQLAAVLAELRVAAARLTEEGRVIRISMIKAQSPSAARVSYLQRQGEIDIVRFGPRKNLSGARRDDFVQEYVIRDKRHNDLWWAHFHYSSEDAAADRFTAAHLKVPAQRTLGYKSMLRAALSNNEVVSIYRSVIGKDLAQRLFLSLAPEAVTAQD